MEKETRVARGMGHPNKENEVRETKVEKGEKEMETVSKATSSTWVETTRSTLVTC